MRDIPLFIRTPARYLGTEVNLPRKRLKAGMFRVALAFADIYEVGMSHIGLKILYDILNRRPDIFCERVFAPWTDMMEYMRKRGMLLTSLETRTPLNQFDMIGFSLQYEMSYPTLLTLLAMGGIPVRAEERSREAPWVLAGGPCAVNPEPLAAFIDAFVIGDGERVILEIVDCLKLAKKDGVSREAALEALSAIEGVYVPAHFEARYDGNGRPIAIRGVKGKGVVRRRIEGDLDALPFPTREVVPIIRTVHDRYAVEIARGCLQGCRFCQAGFTYRPYRERSLSHVLDLLEKGLQETGYGECSFLSLSAGDYSRISRLLEEAVERNYADRVSISLPSLRITSLTPEMIERIKAIRKTGFTLAPEAGTQRLRDVINKKIDEDEIFTTIETIFSAGWHLVKLYFMIGLPTEQWEDLEGLVNLVVRVWRMARKISAKNEVTVSVSTFIPKPHTPFQWCAMASLEEIQEKQQYLKRALSRRGLRFKWHDARLSFWEATISRGGRPLGEFLLRLSQMGAYLDGWTDQFSEEIWEGVAKDFGSPVLASGREAWAPEALFPWEMVDIGVQRRFLWEEYQRALKATWSPPCPDGDCRRCGVCDRKRGIAVVRRDTQERRNVSGAPQVRPGDAGKPEAFLHATLIKVGEARYLGHLDMVRAVLMAARRSRLPMAFSQGFHPAPKVRFSPPIPLGMESLCEAVEIALVHPCDPSAVKREMNAFLPKGVRLTRVRVGALKRKDGFDSLKRSFFMCLLRTGDTDKALSWGKRVSQLVSGALVDVSYPVQGEEKILSVRGIFEVESVHRFPAWLRLDVWMGPLPKGVRPMPLMARLLGVGEDSEGCLRMIKVRPRKGQGAYE